MTLYEHDFGLLVMYCKTLENDAKMALQVLSSLSDIYDEILHNSVVSCFG